MYSPLNHIVGLLRVNFLNAENYSHCKYEKIYSDMNERALFWLGFCGGVIRIFGILALLLAVCMILVASLRGEWRAVVIIFPFSAVLNNVSIRLLSIEKGHLDGFSGVFQIIPPLSSNAAVLNGKV